MKQGMIRNGISTIICTAATMTLVACGGPSMVKVDQWETVTNSGGNSSIQRIEVSYVGDSPDIISVFDDNQLEVEVEFFYADGDIESVELRDGQTGAVEITGVFTWDGDDLQETVWTEASGDSKTVAYDFDDGLLDRIRYNEFDQNGNTGDIWDSRLSYDDDGRLDKIQNNSTWGGTQAISYDDQGEVKRMSYTLASGGIGSTFNYSYNDDGQLDEVRESGSTDTYTLDYDDGNVGEVFNSWNGGSTTTDFSYGKGSNDNLVFGPGIPNDWMFDLEGHSVDYYMFNAINTLLND